MALTKYKLGELIQESFRKNNDLALKMDAVRGISNAKQITLTKADVTEEVLHKFYVVYPGEFVYNPRTTRMGDKVGLGYNNTNEPLLFSFNNIAFFIKAEAQNIILPEYLYMYYNRAEFDRYAITHSWGSATELFTFEEMCDIDIELPSLQIQRKYVEVYKAMLANQHSYERGLENLKTTMNMFYDRLKHASKTKISDLIEIQSNKNTDFAVSFSQLRGINEFGEFTSTRDSIGENDIDKYLIIDDGSYAVNFMCLGNFGKFYLAYNDFGEKYLVSPACNAFKIISASLNPYYFLYVLRRDEFQRKCVFYGDGNTRGGININNFSNIEIPVPTVREQIIISNLYKSYENRRKLNAYLKEQIKSLFPILIKGSLEEARQEEAHG